MKNLDKLTGVTILLVYDHHAPTVLGDELAILKPVYHLMLCLG